MFIKRLMASLSGIAIAGVLFFGCEKMTGPDPELSTPRTQLQMVPSTPDGAFAPIPLASVQQLYVDNAVMVVILKSPTEPGGQPMEAVAQTMVSKIIFQ